MRGERGRQYPDLVAVFKVFCTYIRALVDICMQLLLSLATLKTQETVDLMHVSYSRGIE